MECIWVVYGSDKSLGHEAVKESVGEWELSLSLKPLTLLKNKDLTKCS